MLLNQQKKILIKVCRHYFTTFKPERLSAFEQLWQNLSSLDSAENMLLAITSIDRVKPTESLQRKYFDRELHDSAVSLLKIGSNFLEIMGVQTTDLTRAQVIAMIDKAIRLADPPPPKIKGLRESFVKALLVVDGDEDLLGPTKLTTKPYLAYVGSNDPKDWDENDLRKVREQNSKNKFDLYVENLADPIILVKGVTRVFRDHTKNPFQLICYLLARVGQKIGYDEIYYTIIEGSKYSSKTERGRTVRKLLDYTRQQLRNVIDVNESEPDDWFLQIPIAKIIVSVNLNSCLIIKGPSPDEK